jgi:hypothetical protein
MKHVSTTLICEGCSAKNPVKFIKPSLFKPTMFTFVCTGCDSKWFTKASVIRPKKGQAEFNAGKVVIEFRLVTAGAKLLKILELRADAQMKKKLDLVPANGMTAEKAQ